MRPKKNVKRLFEVDDELCEEMPWLSDCTADVVWEDEEEVWNL